MKKIVGQKTIPETLPSLVRPLDLQVHKVGAEPGPDEKLVSKTYEYLKKVVQRHFHEAMLEAGEYIIKEFFAGNHELARNPRNAVKIESLNQLIKRLQEDDGKAPSKTWVYDAVKLAVDEHYFAKINFRTYGKLGHSQKVYLTHVKNLETKRELILEVVENNYTVARTRERIAEVQGHDLHEKFSLDSVPTAADLEKAGRDGELVSVAFKVIQKDRNHFVLVAVGVFQVGQLPMPAVQKRHILANRDEIASTFNLRQNLSVLLDQSGIVLLAWIQAFVESD